LLGIHEQFASMDKYAALANCMVIFFAFIPYFAFRELGRIIGREKMVRMFFSEGSGSATGQMEGWYRSTKRCFIDGQFCFKNCGRLPAEEDAIWANGNAEDAAAGGGLVGEHFGFAELGGPVGGEAAVGGAGDGVFGDADGGGEEAGDEIEIGGLGARGDDDAYAVELDGEL
jgi:hypothetical protein